MVDFEIAQNDLLPKIPGQLKQNGAAVPLTGATVEFHMKGPLPATTVKVNAAATIVDAATGEVEYAWSGTDTDTIGLYEGEWEVTYTAGSKPMTFPPKPPKISIRIYDDIA